MRNTFQTMTLPIVFITSLFSGGPACEMSNIHSDYSSVSYMVNHLGQIGIWLILGAVILFGMIWIGYICSACRLPKAFKQATGQGNTRIILFITGLSFLWGSCSVEQRARAADMHNAIAANETMCMAHHQQMNRGYFSLQERSYMAPYYDWDRFYICKFCGQRIYYYR